MLFYLFFKFVNKVDWIMDILIRGWENELIIYFYLYMYKYVLIYCMKIEMIVFIKKKNKKNIYNSLYVCIND